jgi:hypothetical protein
MPARRDQLWHPHAAISQWAVAGGIVGYPVHIVFQDYPPSLIAELYRRLKAWVEKEAVCSVFGLSDFRQLAASLDAVRLVLLFDQKLFNKTCWLLDLHRKPGLSGRGPTPVLFTSQMATAAGEVPGASLVLHGCSPQVKSLEAWLDSETPWEKPLPKLAQPATTFNPPQLELLPDQTAVPGLQALGFRDREILRSLLVGAAVCRRVQEGVLDNQCRVSHPDYHAVHKALQSAATRTADEHFDPLALTMVRRANAYVLMKTHQQEKREVRTDGTDDAPSDERNITRREITDLGNIRGQTVQSLVNYLLQQAEAGLTIFSTIGTNRRLNENDGWPYRDATLLAQLLLSWSPKQTRTRFEALQKQGMITVSQTAANQPLVYRLPESLSNPDSPFRSLPKPAEFERALAQR